MTLYWIILPPIILLCCFPPAMPRHFLCVHAFWLGSTALCFLLISHATSFAVLSAYFDGMQWLDDTEGTMSKVGIMKGIVKAALFQIFRLVRCYDLSTYSALYIIYIYIHIVFQFPMWFSYSHIVRQITNSCWDNPFWSVQLLRTVMSSWWSSLEHLVCDKEWFLNKPSVINRYWLGLFISFHLDA